MTGAMYALITAVLARQYSRISGAMSLERDTAISDGGRECRRCPPSCAGSGTNEESTPRSTPRCRRVGSRRLRRPVFVEFDERLTAVVEPLGNLMASLARNERLGLLGLQVVELVANLAADLEHVSEASVTTGPRARPSLITALVALWWRG